MKALALSILKRDSWKAPPQPEYVEAYCSALKALRTGIARSHPCSYADFAAASMCLTLSEVSNSPCYFLNHALEVAYTLQVMNPASKHGWVAHVKGVGELMQRHGPVAHVSGIAHKLFVGFRPLLVSTNT
jgi:hypothetical protein